MKRGRIDGALLPNRRLNLGVTMYYSCFLSALASRWTIRSPRGKELICYSFLLQTPRGRRFRCGMLSLKRKINITRDHVTYFLLFVPQKHEDWKWLRSFAFACLNSMKIAILHLDSRSRGPNSVMSTLRYGSSLMMASQPPERQKQCQKAIARRRKLVVAELFVC
jgi:hypothetical protein